MTGPPVDAPLPSQTELVIGFVGAVGIDLGEVYRKLAAVLTDFEYQCHDVHLTDQLQDLDWECELKEAPHDERLWSYMDAGNELRREWDRDDAFALLAINAITLQREEAGVDREFPLDRHAYVLRSLKRSEEAALLRNVYGSRFVQLSLYAPEPPRLDLLETKITESRVHPLSAQPVYSARRLVERDQAEAAAHGQNVRGIFHRGDFFVDTTRDLDSQLRRIAEILFGHPNRTPTRDEAGMFQAMAASRRSAELGRQVGAAICTEDGSVVAVGVNEVPKPKGGMYWEDDPNDAREFQLGIDTNDRRKSELVAKIANSLVGEERLVAEEHRSEVVDLIAGSEIDDLIEFVRAVHAEMAAITDAARRGISIADCILYATTFPCHHCARHIIAAGITRVVYVAPYAKSLAADLHSDALCVDPSGPDDPCRREVTFEPFVGVGPSRFLAVFEMPKRKDATGRVLPFDPKTAVPRLAEIEPDDMLAELQPYVRRERRALELLDGVQADRGPRFHGYEPPPAVDDGS